jgi:hypothetical protein
MGIPSLALTYLLEGCELPAEPVPNYAGGIWREEQGEVVCENAIEESETPTGRLIKSNARSQRYHSRIRGGVEARIELSSEQFGQGSGDLGLLRQRVMNSRPSPTTLVWEITT